MIKVNDVVKDYDRLRALNGVKFDIPSGQFLGLLGPNGAGKTTLIKTMIGLLEATEGEILYQGVPMSRKNVEVKKQLGVVSQHVNLDKELTVRENMYFAGKLYQMKKKDIELQIDNLLKLMGMEALKHRQIKTLSGGMKRKLMIAKALIHKPKYIFLDEPTVGIDVHARKEIWQFLKLYHQAGHTIILTTHYIEEAEALCDYVRLIHKGENFKSGTSLELIEEMGAYKVTADDQLAFFKSLEAAKDYATTLNTVYRITKTTLEDVFFKYTKEQVS